MATSTLEYERSGPVHKETVASIETALAASRKAVERLIADAEATGPAWATPCAPGKWSPSQIVEHVARSFDASVRVAAGEPSAFPQLPAIFHPLLRLVFRVILKRRALPNGRTTKAMNPVAGPATPAEGRLRIEAAHDRYERAWRELARHRAFIMTPMFGRVRTEEFVHFMEIHTRHHHQQIKVAVPA